MAAINSIPPFVGACSNKQEREKVLSNKGGASEVAHGHLYATNVTGETFEMAHAHNNLADNDHGNTNNSSLQNHVNGTGEEGENEVEDSQNVIDIHINNVVCSFSVRCHINLKRLAMEGANVEYRREHGICNMKLRRPRVTANITSSGKITVTGSTSEDEAKVAARRVARRLQKLGFSVRFCNFRIVNVLGTCSLPFGIKLNNFSNEHPQAASYEPELHPGVTYKIKDPKATLKVFSTGSITITAPCVNNVGLAVEHIYPLVSEFQMPKREMPQNKKAKEQKQHQSYHHCSSVNGFHDGEDDDEFGEASDFDSEDEDFDSDVSHD
ncbi:TATA box-binding protein-like 1 [Babylonia areolata]|uniref:TATA box-binding protein-like 1 n=1 Tax=Babylonia areolata TaxID=304850 RepID=UPI003FD006B4